MLSVCQSVCPTFDVVINIIKGFNQQKNKNFALLKFDPITISLFHDVIKLIFSFQSGKKPEDEEKAQKKLEREKEKTSLLHPQKSATSDSTLVNGLKLHLIANVRKTRTNPNWCH